MPDTGFRRRSGDAGLGRSGDSQGGGLRGDRAPPQGGRALRGRGDDRGDVGDDVMEIMRPGEQGLRDTGDA